MIDTNRKFSKRKKIRIGSSGPHKRNCRLDMQLFKIPITEMKVEAGEYSAGFLRRKNSLKIFPVRETAMQT